MKRLVSLIAVMLLVVGVANAQTPANDEAFTIDLANTNWFPKSGELNDTFVGLSLYKLDSVGTFGSYMRFSTKFDIDTMLTAESKYGFTYGATMNLGQNLYGYGGFGFISDFAHKDSLMGTASYGVLYRGEKVVLGVGDDTNAGLTLSLGGRF